MQETEKYTEQTFNIPELAGISSRTIKEHLGLYRGYVKNTNLILEKIKELSTEAEKNSFLIGELNRRFGFEFNGMRNHEYYFEQFEDGANTLPEGRLNDLIKKQWDSFENWLVSFKQLTATRGIGWAILYYDSKADRLIQSWVDEQHLGQLNGLSMILGLDMWEHSYMLDYAPSEKKDYIEAFFKNINWQKISERLN